MGTTAPQPLKIIYGSLTIGNSNEEIYRVKDGTFEFEAHRLQGTFRFNVLVWGTSESVLVTRCVAFESQFRDRRNSLTISTNSTTHHTYSTSNKTGKNSAATCTQLGGDRATMGMFSGVTREYFVSIDIDLPPPSGTNGRTEISSKLVYKANRERIMTIVAQYNSTSGGTALENYQADSAYYTSVLTTWSDGAVEWKLTHEEWDSPDSNLSVQMTVTRVYEELIRKIRIDYGSLTLGTADPYRILDGWQFKRVRAAYGMVSFNVRVYAATSSELKTNCSAIEEGFAERRKVLKLYYDGVVHNEFLAANIYLDSTADSTSQEGEWFGLTTRDYRVSVSIDLPPKNTDGITEEDVQVNFTASRQMQVTITARYNAISGTGASSLYASNFDTYCSGVLTAVGSGLSFNLVSEKYNTLPVINTQISISRTYEEILFDENDGLRDDLAIRGLEVTVKIGTDNPGDYVITGSSGSTSSSGGTQKRLLTVTVTASCPVEKATDIYDIYSDKLRNYLIAYAKEKSGAVLIAVTSERPGYNPTKNTLEFTIEMQAATIGSGQIIQSTKKISQQNNEGKKIVRAWDGTKYGAFEIDTKAKRIRTVTETRRVIEGNEEVPMPDPLGVGSGPRWVKLDINFENDVKTIGTLFVGGESFKIIDVTDINVYEWVTDPVTATTSPGSISQGL